MKVLFLALVVLGLVGCNVVPPVTIFESDDAEVVCFTSDNISFEPGIYLEGVVFARDGAELIPVHAEVDTKKGTVEMYDHNGENFYQLTLWKL